MKDMDKIYNALEELDRKDANRVSYWDCYLIFSKDTTISTDARAMFKALISLNYSTPNKLMSVYMDMDKNSKDYYFTEWQVLNCKYSMENERTIFIDDLVKADDVDAAPATPGDLISLILPYI